MNTSTTLQNDDALVFAIAANEVWAFEVVLFIAAAANGLTMDFKCAFTIPASATGYWGAASGLPGGGHFETSPTGGFTPAAMTALEGVATFAINLADTGTIGARFSGVAVNSSTAGNVQFQWAQNTSNGSNLTVKANSYILARKLG